MISKISINMQMDIYLCSFLIGITSSQVVMSLKHKGLYSVKELRTETTIIIMIRNKQD